MPAKKNSSSVVAPSTKTSIPQKSSHAAKHAFLYLTSFFTLSLVAFNVGMIFFQIINYYFPEEIMSYGLNFSQDALKFAVSTLLVAAPIYYFVTRNINRNISKKDLDEDSGVRKWLTYIVLFITLTIVIGDVISAFYSFLNGELTVRFLLKVLVILVISGGIFLYYFSDIRNRDERSRNQKNNMWGMAFWVLVLVPFVWSFVLLENPMDTRKKRIDTDTVYGLQNVNSAVQSYYSTTGTLPTSLTEVSSSPQYYMPNLTNLEKRKLAYRKITSTDYELCAQFESDTRNETNSDSYYYMDESWKHPSGFHCYSLKAPERMQ